MSKWMSDAAIEGGINFTQTMTLLSVLKTVATPVAGDLAGDTLASVAIDSGDFTEADGDSGGRKVTIAAQTGLTASASGNALHLVLSLSGVVHVITTITSKKSPIERCYKFLTHKI